MENDKKASWLKSFLKKFTAQKNDKGVEKIFGPIAGGIITAWKNLPANLKKK